MEEEEEDDNEDVVWQHIAVASLASQHRRSGFARLDLAVILPAIALAHGEGHGLMEVMAMHGRAAQGQRGGAGDA